MEPDALLFLQRLHFSGASIFRLLILFIALLSVQLGLFLLFGKRYVSEKFSPVSLLTFLFCELSFYRQYSLLQ